MSIPKGSKDPSTRNWDTWAGETPLEGVFKANVEYMLGSSLYFQTNVMAIGAQLASCSVRTFVRLLALTLDYITKF